MHGGRWWFLGPFRTDSDGLPLCLQLLANTLLVSCDMPGILLVAVQTIIHLLPVYKVWYLVLSVIRMEACKWVSLCVTRTYSLTISFSVSLAGIFLRKMLHCVNFTNKTCSLQLKTNHCVKSVTNDEIDAALWLAVLRLKTWDLPWHHDWGFLPLQVCRVLVM